MRSTRMQMKDVIKEEIENENGEIHSPASPGVRSNRLAARHNGKMAPTYGSPSELHESDRQSSTSKALLLNQRSRQALDASASIVNLGLQDSLKQNMRKAKGATSIKHLIRSAATRDHQTK